MTVQPPSDLDYSDTKLLVEELRAHRHVWMGRSRRVLEGLRAADQPFRIHLVSPATRDKNFYILLTEGLSLHAMPAPPELAGKGLERIELMLLLPPTLPLENVRESWYVKLVTKLARQVMQQEDFLCWGSRFENGEPFVPDSKLCGGVLLNCGILPSAASICNVRPGLCVRYYQIMLLTQQELDYQAACGTDALLELLAGSVTSVTDLSRRNIADSGYLMDWEAIHAGTIRRKDLPRMEIEGFSHMAVYLRWCIEHNLMSEAFQQDFPKEIQKVLENEDDYFLDSLSDFLADDGNDPEIMFRNELIREEIELTLSELPPEQRSVFELTEYDGIPYKEIAETTGVPVPTLLSRKHYAIGHLRKRLQQLYREIVAR